MSVQVLRGWSDSDWDDEVRRSPEGTMFHTRLWSRICVASFPELRDRSLWVEVTTDAGSSRHQLPLLEWRRGAGLVNTVHSSFPFLYGGPLPLRGAGGRVVLPEILEFLETVRGTVLVTSNPLAERPFDRLPSAADDATGRRDAAARADAADGIRAEQGRAPPPAVSSGMVPSANWEQGELTTHLRTLPETESAFWDDELPPRRRNDVRRLTKKGVSIEESQNPDDVSAVYRLYRASFERWGGAPAFVHPELFYQNLVSRGQGDVRFSVARFEGAVIGGVFALRFGRAVHYFAGYMDSEAKALRPNVLLQVDSILHGIRDRYAFYDFLPSGGNEPVEQFKEGFGGVRYSLPVFTRRSLAHRLLARARGR